MDFKVFGRASAGGTVPILVRVREKTGSSTEMPLTNIYGISASVISPTGVTLVADGSFSFIQDGEYVFQWDTADLATGNYIVSISITVSSGGSPIKQKGIVRLY